MDAAELRERVSQVRWFHTIDLGQEVVTPGRDRTPQKLQRVRLPSDLSGQSVLDIGAWDGFFSFECERRGAARVMAIDDYTWPGGAPGGGSKAGFELAREALGSRVEDSDVAFADLSPDALGGQFDVVLFLGVLYHMEHPWAALEKAASVCTRLLIVETHVDMLGYRRPAAAFYPGTELNRDVTNWWGPNPACVEGMLRPLGFQRVETVWLDSTPRRVARAAYRLVRPPRLNWRMGRAVFHAHR